LLDKDLDLQQHGAAKNVSDGEALYASAQIWTWSGIAIAAFICLLAGWMAAARVSRPIGALTASMTRLAEHNLDTAIDGRGRKDAAGGNRVVRGIAVRGGRPGIGARCIASAAGAAIGRAERTGRAGVRRFVVGHVRCIRWKCRREREDQR
jgi:HAMP domain-containing protein